MKVRTKSEARNQHMIVRKPKEDIQRAMLYVQALRLDNECGQEQLSELQREGLWKKLKTLLFH